MVVKIIQLIGSSKEGWQEATQNAVDEAARTVKNIQSVHVKRCTAKVKENKIVEYRAVVNIAFVYIFVFLLIGWNAFKRAQILE